MNKLTSKGTPTQQQNRHNTITNSFAQVWITKHRTTATQTPWMTNRPSPRELQPNKYNRIRNNPNRTKSHIQIRIFKPIVFYTFVHLFLQIRGSLVYFLCSKIALFCAYLMILKVLIKKRKKTKSLNPFLEATLTFTFHDMNFNI